MRFDGSNTDSKGSCHFLLGVVSDVAKNDHLLLSPRQPTQGPHEGVTLRDITLGISSHAHWTPGSFLADLVECKVDGYPENPGLRVLHRTHRAPTRVGPRKGLDGEILGRSKANYPCRGTPHQCKVLDEQVVERDLLLVDRL